MSAFDLNVPNTHIDAVTEYLELHNIAFQRNASVGFTNVSVDEQNANDLKSIASDMRLAHGIINRLKIHSDEAGGITI